MLVCLPCVLRKLLRWLPRGWCVSQQPCGAAVSVAPSVDTTHVMAQLPKQLWGRKKSSGLIREAAAAWGECPTPTLTWLPTNPPGTSAPNPRSLLFTPCLPAPISASSSSSMCPLSLCSLWAVRAFVPSCPPAHCVFLQLSFVCLGCTGGQGQTAAGGHLSAPRGSSPGLFSSLCVCCSIIL